MQPTSNNKDNNFRVPTIPPPKTIHTSSTTSPDLSYFFPYLQQIVSKFDRIPNLLITNDNEIPPEYRPSIHPTWTNWNKVWSSPPIVINTTLSPKPTLEFAFQSVLFRIQLSSTYFLTARERRKIFQGTTFVFKGYEDSNVCFVVEWCHLVDRHDAYLKLVGMNEDGGIFPWSDPDFPSFILVVPFCTEAVPSPPNVTLYYWPPLHNNSNMRDFTICWACGKAFEL
jgi:hypothetical protein